MTQTQTPPETLTERSYQVLRDRLIMVDIAPGDPINEQALMEELQMGRTPIREALKLLEVDHLVVSFPRRGTFATQVDIAELSAISQMRLVLEPLAGSRAAEFRGGPYADQLRAVRERLVTRDYLGRVSRRELIEDDVEVHRLVYRAAQNYLLEETLIRLDNLATRIWCIMLDRLSELVPHVAEHIELIDMILAGDTEGAAADLRDHVTNFEAMVRAAL